MPNYEKEMKAMSEDDNLSKEQRKAIRKAAKILSFDECVRLYNSKGEHVLSLVRCYDDGGFDLCTPLGMVVWADCDADMVEFWEMLAKIFGVEQVKHLE